MIKEFFKISCRFFIREKLYTVLNIIGLSIGIAVALIIFIYLQDDLTYDRYHEKARNIFRVNSIYVSSGKENKFALSPVSIGPKLKEEFPEVQAFTRMVSIGKVKLSYDDKNFFEENLIVVDSNFFDIFTGKFILGDPSTCLSAPNSIVLTEKLARKYFGDIDPLGKILFIDKTQTFEITAIIKDPPQNLHFKYDALVPVKHYDPTGNLNNSSLFDISVYTYLLLPDNYDIKQYYSKFPAFYEKHASKLGKALNQQYKAVIQPLTDIHFSKEWTYDLPNGNIIYVYVFLIIGVLVLSLSSINYLNLTTARSEKRIREISVKKILGSKSSELMVQFLCESMLMAVVAMIVALSITWFVLGFTKFDQLIDKGIRVVFSGNPLLIPGIILLTVFAGLASGLYPAFYLSNIHPLKSSQKINGTGLFAFSLRKLLVVVQMVISIGVVIFTMLIDSQIRFVSKKDLGINTENQLILPLRDTAMVNHLTSFKEKLLLNPSIGSVTTAYSLPAGGLGNLLYRVETGNGLEENNFYSMFVSYDFIETLGIKLLSGRDFSREYSSDFRSSFIINETLARKMGWTNPIGKRMQQNFDSQGKPYYDGTVIGVIRDFNYTSLHNAIEPLVLRLQNREGGQLLLKLKDDNIESTIHYIEQVWKEYSNDFPRDYSFLDRNLELLYEKDRQQNMLVKIFSWICILISILGLISLASYITKNRTREIAIRKVYGGSTTAISFMLIREILILVVIAAIIAGPIAYWLTDKALDNFAYKAGLNIGTFLITTCGAIILALGIVTYHSLKASIKNTAGILKHE